MRIVDTIYLRARMTPECPAIITPEGIINYAQLARAIESASGYFERSIPDASNPVGVLINTRSKMMVATLGLLHAGFTVAPLDPSSLKDLGQTGSKTLVHERGSATIPGGANIPFDDFWQTNVANQGKNELPLRPREDEGGNLIFFSSGTTGKPKPIILDPGTFIQQMSLLASPAGYERILILPGLSISWGCLEACDALCAGKAICFSPLGESVLRILNLYKIDTLIASTQQALQLVEIQEKSAYSLPSLRTLKVGGSLVAQESILSLKRHLCNNLIISYGTTECGMAAIAPYDLIAETQTAVGFVVPGAEVEIVDASDRVLPVGSEGFVRIRPRKRIANPSDAAAAPWFYPGDLGTLTAKGVLCIAGRRGNVLNRGGVKFDIDDIENFLLSCPGVKDAGVYSFKSAGLDEVWAALVFDPAIDMALLREKIEADEQFGSAVDKVFVVDAIPRGVLGKIQRDELGQMLKSITQELE